MIGKKNFFQHLSSDLPAGLVVFLVALPLCLGVALASGAPLFSGIIAGMVGGLVIGAISGSPLSVSGPAAGLTTLVLDAITTLGTFEAFLVTVVMAGFLQVLLGLIGAGTIGHYFPASVIKGMLAAIGLILILKQIPHAIGYDKDYEGDESFTQADGENTFTELFTAYEHITWGALCIGVVAMALLLLLDTPVVKRNKILSFLPAPLWVVLAGIVLNLIFQSYVPALALEREHLVTLPVARNFGEFASQFSWPDFTSILRLDGWIVATTTVTIALVASLETLLSVDAVDRLDPLKRSTPLNRELLAQGAGNMVSGLIGGLPVTAVIVRSSANVSAGARTQISVITHGFLLLFTVLFIPHLLNLIPLAALAAILIVVGYKLVKPSLIATMYRQGKDQFIPFVVTIGAILLTNLLIGIFIGIGVGLIFVLKTNFKKALVMVQEGNHYLIRLNKDVSFLNKALLRQTFRTIPDNSVVLIDGSRSAFIDQDILETIADFRAGAVDRQIVVELKQSVAAPHPLFQTKA